MASDQGILGHTHEIGVRWQNFRAFEDSGWLRIKPLTVFIGANNSGKSSLLEPLLLMKQSLLSRTGGNALLTRGTYHDSGAFRDFVHGHDAKRPVTFEIRWHSHPPTKTMDPVGAYPPGGAQFTFRQGEEPETVSLDAYRIADTHRRRMLQRKILTSKRFSLNMNMKLPKAREKQINQKLRRVIRRDRPQNFLFLSTAIRQASIIPSEVIEQQSLALGFDDPRVDAYTNAVDYVEFRIENIFDSLFYVGPLREPAKRVYGLSGEMPPDVGTRGENAPEIIYRWRRKPKVLRELRKWLERFEFNADLTWDDVGLEGFSLLLQHEKDVPTSFLDVGFGVSQVLPLIVQGLKSPKRSWMITEQPEIHLNPRLQAKLADYFVALAKGEKGVLVETHSEHLLLRLRTLVAQGEISSDDVALYYVEPGEQASSVREVPIESTGHIDRKNWPSGFFEDSLREAMVLARTQSQSDR